VRPLFVTPCSLGAAAQRKNDTNAGPKIFAMKETTPESRQENFAAKSPVLHQLFDLL
jgi:hypothetical protein